MLTEKLEPTYVPALVFLKLFLKAFWQSKMFKHLRVAHYWHYLIKKQSAADECCDRKRFSAEM